MSTEQSSGLPSPVNPKDMAIGLVSHFEKILNVAGQPIIDPSFRNNIAGMIADAIRKAVLAEREQCFIESLRSEPSPWLCYINGRFCTSEEYRNHYIATERERCAIVAETAIVILNDFDATHDGWQTLENTARLIRGG